MKRAKRLPRPRAHGRSRQAKASWPPKCFALPDSVEAIERGITPAIQRARDRHAADLLLPIGGALVAVPGPQDAPGHDDVSPADLETPGEQPAERARPGPAAENRIQPT